MRDASAMAASGCSRRCSTRIMVTTSTESFRAATIQFTRLEFNIVERARRRRATSSMGASIDADDTAHEGRQRLGDAARAASQVATTHSEGEVRQRRQVEVTPKSSSLSSSQRSLPRRRTPASACADARERSRGVDGPVPPRDRGERVASELPQPGGSGVQRVDGETIQLRGPSGLAATQPDRRASSDAAHVDCGVAGRPPGRHRKFCSAIRSNTDSGSVASAVSAKIGGRGCLSRHIVYPDIG